MFSYKIRVRVIQNPRSSLVGFASITLDDVIEFDNFKIINGRNGLFVGVPNHKGSIMEDGVKVEKYFDDVRFTEEGQEFADEFKQAIITAYKDASGSSQNQSPGATSKPKTRAKVAATQTDNSPPTSDADEPARKRKPLWGY